MGLNILRAYITNWIFWLLPVIVAYKSQVIVSKTSHKIHKGRLVDWATTYSYLSRLANNWCDLFSWPEGRQGTDWLQKGWKHTTFRDTVKGVGQLWVEEQIFAQLDLRLDNKPDEDQSFDLYLFSRHSGQRQTDHNLQWKGKIEKGNDMRSVFLTYYPPGENHRMWGGDIRKVTLEREQQVITHSL